MRYALSLLLLAALALPASAQCGYGANFAFAQQAYVAPLFLAPPPVVFVGGFNFASIGHVAYGAGVNRVSIHGQSFSGNFASGSNFQQIREVRGPLGRVRERTVTQVNNGAGNNIANVGRRR